MQDAFEMAKYGTVVLVGSGGRAAHVIAKALLNQSAAPGIYYDEKGHSMLASRFVRILSELWS